MNALPQETEKNEIKLTHCKVAEPEETDSGSAGEAGQTNQQEQEQETAPQEPTTIQRELEAQLGQYPH